MIFIDKRNELIEYLSKIVDVEIKENNKGLVMISMDEFFLISESLTNESLVENSIIKSYRYPSLILRNESHQLKLNSGIIYASNLQYLTYETEKTVEVNDIDKVSLLLEKIELEFEIIKKTNNNVIESIVI